MDAQLLYAAAVLGLIPAIIGKRKGYSFVGWWCLGFVAFIIALPWVLLVKKNPAKYRQCPSCREWIDPQAVACPNCGRDVPELPGFTPAERTVDRANWPWYAFVGACLLIAFGAAAWAVL